MKKIIKILLSIPNTIKLNLLCFPFQEAIKIPVIVSYSVKMCNLRRGAIKIDGIKSRGMISIGVAEGTDGIHDMKGRGYIRFGKEGTLIFKGKAQFAKGISLNVDTGKIIFGNGFTCNKYCFIASSERIIFGDDVMLGPYTTIRDMDGHNIYENTDIDMRQSINKANDIFIGNHVWTGANASILKGSQILDGCIVAYGACVTKAFEETGCIIGGVPGKVIKKNIKWVR